VLTERQATFTRRDFFKERFTAQELRNLLAAGGLTPHDVLSRRSRGYKELVEGREDELTDEQLLALMAQEPTLLRRPLAIRDGKIVVGFDRDELVTLAE
jgi:Spx/MgsR family transcriptional regulator